MANDANNLGFDQVFPELFLSAFHVAHRILGDVTDAEDAAAEGLARALSSWRRVSQLPYRDAWVMRVTANVALDRLRKQRRPPPSVAPASHDPTDAEVLRIALAGALRAISRRQRQVVALRYLADLTEAEVACSLGISVNSVKKHGRRGIDALRERLGPHWEETNLALE